MFLSATRKPSLPVTRPTSISGGRLLRLPSDSNQERCRVREGGYNDACRTVRHTRFRRDCSAAFTFDLSALYLQRITRMYLPLSATCCCCTCTDSLMLQHVCLIAYSRSAHIGANETVQLTAIHTKTFDSSNKRLWKLPLNRNLEAIRASSFIYVYMRNTEISENGARLLLTVRQSLRAAKRQRDM